MRKDIETTNNDHRNFLKTVVFGSAAAGAAAGLFSDIETASIGVPKAAAAENLKMAFIQWQPHTVPAAWSKGIEEVLKTQQTIDYELLMGRTRSRFRSASSRH